VERDALAEDSLLQAARSLTLSVELSGMFIPLDAQTVGEVSRWAETTEWGLAARVDDHLSALFPGEMRHLALLEDRAVRAVLGEHGVLPANLPELLTQGRAKMYRFHSVQRAQPGPGQPSKLMHRGGSVVDLREVRREELLDAARRLAAHLRARLWPGDEPLGLLSLYEPWSDAADPAVSTTAQDALAAYALLRFAGVPEVGEARGEQARMTALELLRRANERRLAREDQQFVSIDDAAAVVLACTELDADERSDACRQLLDQAMELIAAVLRSEPGLSAVQQGPLVSRGLLAQALVRLEREAPQRFPNEGVSAYLEQTWAGIPAETLVSAMPFLGWAELERAAHNDGPVARSALMRTMRARVWQHQLDFTSVDERNRDLAGGIIFSLNERPLPTSATLRPLAVLSTMLGEETLTETSELTGETFQLLQASRFLLQLTMREDELYMARNPLRAEGGVRAAVWDNRMPVDASSLGLLSLVELLKSLDAVQRRLPTPEG
jgi:hypothetical protein